MSKRNKHGWNNTINGGISYRYLRDELGTWNQCPRRNCDGCLTDVYVRYVSNGPIFTDKECPCCGKVMRDPTTSSYFKDINLRNKEMRQSSRKGKFKKIQTNRQIISKAEVLTNPRLRAAVGLSGSTSLLKDRGVNNEIIRRK